MTGSALVLSLAVTGKETEYANKMTTTPERRQKLKEGVRARMPALPVPEATSKTLRWAGAFTPRSMGPSALPPKSLARFLLALQ